ncbi:hypothetical protein GCM10011450_10760 [Advenella faeciporci]|uniref:Uncharacterized protein n=2 Tax=Advenella faeciporci TaxID=797535 RepID=A0A918JJI5_9BURK|nr:hypothetical protein GCM10011450_10760 [Advenella faeciporci]
MGNKKFRKIGGKVATYGGVAALGAAAYHAYGQWKENKTQPQQTSSQPDEHAWIRAQPTRPPLPNKWKHPNWYAS